MKIIGVTGSSGAGKDTLCEILENKYEAEIVDADKIAKELSKKGTMYFNSIVESFGSGIVDRQGKLNRKKLASIIYEDDKKREELNRILCERTRRISYIDEEEKSIGINNVNTRIKNYYGEKYGVKVNKADKGTEIQLLLGIENLEEENKDK